MRVDWYDRAEARLMGDVAGASFSVRAAEWLRATGGAEGRKVRRGVRKDESFEDH